jgi:hypothetical protein
MFKLSIGGLFILLSHLTIGCTHTATFAGPDEETKAFAPATSRNLENFALEKELAYSRTTGAVCTAGAVLGGIFTLMALGNETSDNEKISTVASGLSLTGASVVCANYFSFISERAAVYLNAAGVKVEF